MKLLLSLLFVFCSLPSLAQTSTNSSLTRKDGKVYISQSRYITSGVASVFPGFGIGHAVQGRWLEKGWKFTAGSSLVIGAGMGLSFLIAKKAADAYICPPDPPEKEKKVEKNLKKETIKLEDAAIKVPLAIAGEVVEGMADAIGTGIGRAIGCGLDAASVGMDAATPAFWATLVLFSAVHVWGAVDTWKLPSNYKITNLSIVPKFYSYRDKTFMGLSLNYKW